MNNALMLIKKIAAWTVSVFLALIILFTAMSAAFVDRTDIMLFDMLNAFIVRTDNMSADFNSGDLAVVKKANNDKLKAGDIIAYKSSEDKNYGELVFGKIRSRTQDEDGEDMFIVYSTANDEDAPEAVGYQAVIGKYKFALPMMGTFMLYLQSLPGCITLILAPCFILLIMIGWLMLMRFKRYKTAELNRINRELDEIEKVRESKLPEPRGDMTVQDIFGR